MRNVIVKFQQARALHQQGQLSKARVILEEILKHQPAHLEVLKFLAIIAGQSRQYARAIRYFNEILAISPHDAATYCNRGLALQELAQPNEALTNYNRAIAIKPGYAVAYYNRANVLKELGKPDDALLDYDRALAAHPGLVQAHYNRGIILQDFLRWADALSSYDRTIALKADYAEAHYNRGVVLQTIERWEQALASYDRAIQIRPDHAEAYANRGIVLRTIQQTMAALDSFDRAIAIKPSAANVHFNRGNALADLKRYPEGIESYDRALALGSDGTGLHGSRRHAKIQICDWTHFAEDKTALTQRIEQHQPAAPPFHVLVTSDAGRLQRLAAEAWVRKEHPADPAPHDVPTHGRHDKIRLGYFSADFHNHATLYLMAELLERHDRTRFEVVAFSFGPDRPSVMRARLQTACDKFIDVRGLSDADVAALARDSQIDIAIDLKGYTQFSRPGIFARRAAPLQVSYLGYPGTMGASFMDYLVADHTLIPEGSERHYSEKLIYMPGSYQVNDSRRRIADTVLSRQELALPAVGIVFCCFNNHFKITPDIFDVWMHILQRVPGSVLWLYEENPIAADNLRREAERRQVDGARLIFATFMELPEHLARHRAADLFLDTLPYNAHTTASDALWAGLPVLTCTGEAFASRVAASLLMAVEMPELVTSTLADYEELAVSLAMNPPRLLDVKRRLAAHRLTKPLFDAKLFTDRLEDAYTKIYDRKQAGLPCEHVRV